MKPSMAGRSCDKDRFQITDRADSVTTGIGMGPTCVLGPFKPVAKAQLQEMENRLEMR